MSLAETAQLAVELKLNGAGGFVSGMSQAEAATSKLNVSAGSIGGALGKAEKGIVSLGGALGHAGSQIKGLVTGPLGLIGLTGGLFSLGGIFESSIRHASDMGFAVEKLTGLTGESATSMSQLLVTFEKFGIDADKTAQIVGFTEKTLGHLTDTTVKAGTSAIDLAKAQDNVTKAHEKLQIAQLKLGETENKSKATASQLAAARYKVRDATAALSEAEANLASAQGNKGSVSTSKALELQTKYGVQLLDTSGKALAFGTILGNVADFYNSSATQSDKAALAALLFGRGYAQMIPILKLGSQGIKDAEQSAADLGLTLTDQNAQELKDYRGAIRDVGEAIGGLQLQIGLALIPEVQKLAVGLTSFLENGGSKQIVQFFKDGAKFAENMGHVIETDVVPVFQGIVGAWNKIPGDLKSFLVTAFVANKTSKFLFDFGIGDLAKQFGSGGVFSRGATAAAPLYVQDVLADLGGGSGGLGLLGKLSSLVLKVTMVGIAAEAAIQISKALGIGFDPNNPNKPGQDLMWPYGPKNTPDINLFGIDHILGGDSGSPNQPGSTPKTPILNNLAGIGLVNGATPLLHPMVNEYLNGGPGIATDPEAIARLRQVAAAWDTGSERALTHFAVAAQSLIDAGGQMAREFLDHIGGKAGVSERSKLKFGKDPTEAQADATFQRDLIHSAGMIARSSESNDRKLADLKVLEKSGNTATKTAIDRLGKNLQPPSVTVNVSTNVKVTSTDVTMSSQYRRRYGPIIGGHIYGYKG